MNYYEHHLGDYLRDTAHLSMLEDCAYRRLLDAYYARERALPADVRECCKLARASTKQERDAVAYVLREFFVLQDDAYHQARADKEIARFQDKQRKAKASADARWSQYERNAGAMRTHSEGNAPRARPQSPDTNTPSLRSGVARGTRLPTDWVPEVEQGQWTALQARELPKFRDYWTAQPGQKGVKADWQATWRNWIRKAGEYAESGRHSGASSAKPLSAVERVRQACGLDDDGFPLGPDDGNLRPQVDEQLRDEADGRVVEAPFRVVAG
jgi:uncharacterized protein YdaU (DUF1376 family)